MPVIVKISPLPEEAEPNSRTMSITTEWLKPFVPDSESAEQHDRDGDDGALDEEVPF